MKRTLIVTLVIAIVPVFASAAPFSSMEGGFQINAPVTPKEETKELKTVLGTMPLKLFSGSLSDTAMFMVGYADFPKGTTALGNIDDMLDGAVNGATTNTKGTLVRSKKITLGTNPGREADIEILGGKVTIRSRFYLVNDRLYQVLVLTPTTDLNAAEVSNFLDSFKLAD